MHTNIYTIVPFVPSRLQVASQRRVEEKAAAILPHRKGMEKKNVAAEFPSFNEQNSSEQNRTETTGYCCTVLLLPG